MPKEDKTKEKKIEFEFEKSLCELEKIVKDLELGKLSLEECLEKFEKGIDIYKGCKDFLNRTEKRIKRLNDRLKEEDFS